MILYNVSNYTYSILKLWRNYLMNSLPRNNQNENDFLKSIWVLYNMTEQSARKIYFNEK